ncbi:hypothetical protein ACQKQC_15895 [Vibrio fortis]|uniref:hypothetical protein n=1 Tax=Vibrio fortis TaxID=212667 RepID=UPI004067595F
MADTKWLVCGKKHRAEHWSILGTIPKCKCINEAREQIVKKFHPVDELGIWVIDSNFTLRSRLANTKDVVSIENFFSGTNPIKQFSDILHGMLFQKDLGKGEILEVRVMSCVEGWVTFRALDSEPEVEHWKKFLARFKLK